MPRRIPPYGPFVYYGVSFILLYLLGQLTRPFLSDFDKVEGVLVKHETVTNYQRGSNKILKIWLNDTLTQPYISTYNDPQKAIKPHIDNIEQVSVWVNSNREIMQLEASNIKIVEYKWFNPLLLLFLAFGIFFYVLSMQATKKETVNIKTHRHMWEYVLGYREAIMKHNNKPFEPEPFWFFKDRSRK